MSDASANALRVTPADMRRSVDRGLLDAAAARKILGQGEVPREPFLAPKVPPPPERLKLVKRQGRIVRARSQFTKALMAAELIDVEIVKARRPHEQETP